MGIFFSQTPKPETPSLEALAASEQGSAGLKARDEEWIKCPTQPKDWDGRSWSDVVRTGPRKGSVSALRRTRSAEQLGATQTDGKVQVQKRVPEPRRDRQGAGGLRAVQGGGVQEQDQAAHAVAKV